MLTAAMKIQRPVPRRRAARDSFSARMAAVYFQATCVMPRMTVEMDLMNHMKPVVRHTLTDGTDTTYLLELNLLRLNYIDDSSALWENNLTV